MLRSPFISDFVALRDTFDQVANEVFGAVPGQATRSQSGLVASRMPLDVYASDEQAVITAAAPGLRAEELELTVHERTLTLSATIPSVSDAEEAKGATWYLHELGSGAVRRSVTLPFPIDADRVEATVADGVVRVTAPKSRQAKPRKITVNTAQSGAISANASAPSTQIEPTREAIGATNGRDQ